MTAITVEHRELSGWPKQIKGRLDEYAWERKVEVSYANKDLFLAQAVVNPYNIYPYNTSGATLIDFHEEPKPKAKTIAHRTLGTSYAEYEWYWITLQYSTKGPLYNTRLYSESTRPFVRDKHSVGKFAIFADQTSVQDVHVSDGGFEYHLTYYNIAMYPSGFDTGAGLVNAAGFSTSSGISAVAECALYKGAYSKHTRSLLGTTLFTVEMVWAILPHSWNKFWNPNSGSYENIYTRDGALIRPHSVGAPVPS